METLGARLRRAAADLAGPEARIDAELLLAHALGRDRTWLFAHADDALPAPAETAFAALLARRREGEPVAYLLGRREFWRLDLAVDASTLIPRADTERLVELALVRLPEGAASRVLDLGTGSGAVALAIALERPQARVVGVDLSPQALAVARANALANGLESVEWRHGDWLAAVTGETFDVIVGNPPYLAEDDPHLREGDLPREPRTALVSGVDGLDAIRRIVRDALACVVGGGWLLLEHGDTQGEAVRALFVDAGWQAVATERDLEHRERVTVGRR
jgi:release factor glutamine methyltransferase